MSSPTADSGAQPVGEGGLPDRTADSAGAPATAGGAGSASGAGAESAHLAEEPIGVAQPEVVVELARAEAERRCRQ